MQDKNKLNQKRIRMSEIAGQRLRWILPNDDVSESKVQNNVTRLSLKWWNEKEKTPQKYSVFSLRLVLMK